MFELKWRERRYGPSQTPRRFLDYVVDGDPLYDRVGCDLITPFGWSVEVAQERAARRLLGEETPEVDDRVAIYVCPECGDRMCGALTAVIVRAGPDIVWSELAYSTYDFSAGTWDHSEWPIHDWPPLRFEATQYANALVSRPA